ncbi:hypothetical protein CN448_10330, partial [Bacillus cereus]
GPAGATGATGPLITANNARFVNSSTTINVPVGASVPFTVNAELNGTAISHIPGSTNIILAPNQTYYASYQITSSSSNGNVGYQLSLNGNIISGSGASASQAAPSPVEASLSASAVFSTGNAPNILTLDGSVNVVQNGEGAVLNVIKLQ